MTDRFQELHVFVRAAESGSFSATARELGLSQPSVSRIVSELETRLGTKLLLRNTRRIVPTEAGQSYLQRARQIMHDLEQADDAAKGIDSLSGVLRVALSSVLCIRIVLPRLASFLAEHPLLKIEFLPSDLMHDLVVEGADMAVRFGNLQDSGFGVRKLATLPRLLLAAPAYLTAHGSPVTPQDLAGHACISGPSGASVQTWSFTHQGLPVAIEIAARLHLSSAEGIIASAREGLGITRASALMCEEELRSGALVALLPDYALAPVDLHAVYPAGRTPSQKVRAFSAFLSGIFTPAEEGSTTA